jgi:penicillin amidase
MMRLQHDELSIPARTLIPLLRDVALSTAPARAARDRLLEWDYVLDRSSVAAGIYVAFEQHLTGNVTERVLTPEVRRAVRTVQLSRVIQWLLAPDGRFGAEPIATRDSLLGASLEQAVAELTEKLGADPAGWAWGQDRYHHALIRHPMSSAVSPEVRALLDVGPAPRGGYGNTPNATGNGDNQTSGASFRIVADLSDWDHSVGTNTPGQSGDPASPHYRDLFPLWVDGRYFPVLYTRPRVESVTGTRTVLAPASGRHP